MGETERVGCARLFKQQNLPACRPTYSTPCFALGFGIAGVVFIALGVVFMMASQKVQEIVIDTTSCEPPGGGFVGTSCNFSVPVPSNMAGPVYVYYQLTGYYQAHRRYMESFCSAQLQGESTSYATLAANCAPRVSVNGAIDASNQANWYLPCGLVAGTVYSDTILLFDPANNSVVWTSDGTAWASDARKYANPPASQPGQRDPMWTDWTDPLLANWMRVAGLPNFRKLYRIVPGGLAAGLYSIELISRYEVQAFQGRKAVVITTASFLGGKNPFLGTAFLVVGSLALLSVLVAVIADRIHPRSYGDAEYMWADQDRLRD